MSSKNKDILALVARIIVGGIFITTGWLKVSAMAATVAFFAQVGIPAFFAYAVGYLELVGGILVVLGLWSCFATAVLAVIMLFAIWFTRTMGFQGFMPPLAVLGSLLALMAAGDGKYAVKIGEKMQG